MIIIAIKANPNGFQVIAPEKSPFKNDKTDLWRPETAIKTGRYRKAL